MDDVLWMNVIDAEANTHIEPPIPPTGLRFMPESNLWYRRFRSRVRMRSRFEGRKASVVQITMGSRSSTTISSSSVCLAMTEVPKLTTIVDYHQFRKPTILGLLTKVSTFWFGEAWCLSGGWCPMHRRHGAGACVRLSHPSRPLTGGSKN